MMDGNTFVYSVGANNVFDRQKRISLSMLEQPILHPTAFGRLTMPYGIILDKHCLQF